MTPTSFVPRGLADASDRFALPGQATYLDEADVTWVRTEERLSYAHGQRAILHQPLRASMTRTWLERWMLAHAAHGVLPTGPAILQWETAADTPPPRPDPQRLDMIARVAHTPMAAPDPIDGLHLRPLGTDADWDATARLSIEVQSDLHDTPADAGTLQWMYAAWRRQCEQPAPGVSGTWWGVFDDHDRLLGSTGVFVGVTPDGTRPGRLQDVQVDRRHRGRGIGAWLVLHADAWAREQGAQSLWSVTAAGSDGDQLYARLGMGIGARVHEYDIPLRTRR